MNSALIAIALSLTPVTQAPTGPYIPEECKGTTATVALWSAEQGAMVEFNFPKECKGKKYQITIWNRATGKFAPQTFVNSWSDEARTLDRMWFRGETACWQVDFSWLKPDGSHDRDSPFYNIQRGLPGETAFGHSTTTKGIPSCDTTTTSTTNTTTSGAVTTTTGATSTTSPNTTTTTTRGADTTTTTSTSGSGNSTTTTTGASTVPSGPSVTPTLPETGGTVAGLTVAGLFLMTVGLSLLAIKRRFIK